MFALNSPAIHSAMLLFTCSFTLANPILGGRGTTTVSHFKGSPGLPKASPGTPQITFSIFHPEIVFLWALVRLKSEKHELPANPEGHKWGPPRASPNYLRTKRFRNQTRIGNGYWEPWGAFKVRNTNEFLISGGPGAPQK